MQINSVCIFSLFNSVFTVAYFMHSITLKW